MIRQVGLGGGRRVCMMALKRTNYRKLKTRRCFRRHRIVAAAARGGVFPRPGHHRWLRIGPVGLQPSELAKPALVLFLAFFVAWRGAPSTIRGTR